MSRFDENTRTPSRRAQPSMSKILSNDPPTPENTKPLSLDDLKENPARRSQSSKSSDIFGFGAESTGTTPLRRSGIRTFNGASNPLGVSVGATTTTTAAEDAADKLVKVQQQLVAAMEDNSVLRERLNQEGKNREAAEKRAAKDATERQRCELDLQSQRELAAAANKQLEQEREQRRIAEIKAKQTEEALTAQLKRESTLRIQTEAELSHVNKMHNDIMQQRMRDEADTQAAKVGIQQTTKMLAVQEKQLSETQKQDTKRGLDLTEERNMRMRAQEELETLKASSKETIQLLNNQIATLESTVAASRVTERSLIASAQLATAEATKLKTALEAAQDENKLMGQALAENKLTIARLEGELAAERAAYLRLEQQCVADVRTSRKEAENTLERLRVHRDEALQAARASAAMEQTSSTMVRERRQVEDSLSIAMASQTALQHELAKERYEIRPQLEHALREREAQIVALQQELAEHKEQLAGLHIAQSQSSRDISQLNQTIAELVAESKALQSQLSVAHTSLEVEVKQAKTARVRMDQEYDMKQRTLKRTLSKS